MSIVGQVGRRECWTIEIDPSPALVAQSRRWLAKWRRDYHKFTQGLFYETVDAIQSGDMPYKRRGELELAEGCADYFFRRNRREPHIIRITIERINFFHADNDFDPDPNGGETALHPFVPLVIDLSSIDRFRRRLRRGRVAEAEAHRQLRFNRTDIFCIFERKRRHLHA